MSDTLLGIQLRRFEPASGGPQDWLKPRRQGAAMAGREGYDPTYGARPLKRVIQKWVQDPLAQMLLAGELADGSTIKLSDLLRGASDDQRQGGRRRVRTIFECQVAVGRAKVSED